MCVKHSTRYIAQHKASASSSSSSSSASRHITYFTYFPLSPYFTYFPYIQFINESKVGSEVIIVVVGVGVPTYLIYYLFQ